MQVSPRSGFSSEDVSTDTTPSRRSSTSSAKRAAELFSSSVPSSPEFTPVTSPTKKILSPLRKMTIKGKKLDLSDAAMSQFDLSHSQLLHSALQVTTSLNLLYPKRLQPIIDAMDKAMNEHNAEALPSLFSDCGDYLIACYNEVLSGAFEDDDGNFLKEQITAFLSNEFKSGIDAGNSNHAIKYLSLAKTNTLLFTHLLSAEHLDAYNRLEEKLDSKTRLQQAVADKNVSAVQQVIHDCKAFSMEPVIPTLEQTDAAWLKAALSEATVLIALTELHFEPIYQTLANYKLDTKSLDAEILNPLHVIQTKLIPDSKEAIFLQRALAYTHTLKTSLDETKKLTTLEALRIAFFAEKMLQSGPSTPQYFYKGHDNLCRDIIIDKARNSFLVLSGNAGRIKTKGEERFVSNAAMISYGQEARQFVYLVNLEQERSRQDITNEIERLRKQAELAQELNGDIYLTVQTTSSSENPLFIVVEEKYSSSLDTFFKFQDERRLSCAQIKQLFALLSQKLAHMHALGLMHGDINRRNIVCTINSEIKAKIIDFGFTYDPRRSLELLDTFQTSYGTIIYSAPEFFPEQHRKWTLQQLQAFDMYALGCVLYELLFGREHPDWHLKHRYLQGDYEHIDSQSKMHETLLHEMHTCNNGELKELLAFCVELLHPVSEKRMTSAQLQAALN